jgi:hypothetical protein
VAVVTAVAASALPTGKRDYLVTGLHLARSIVAVVNAGFVVSEVKTGRDMDRPWGYTP